MEWLYPLVSSSNAGASVPSKASAKPFTEQIAKNQNLPTIFYLWETHESSKQTNADMFQPQNRALAIAKTT